MLTLVLWAGSVLTNNLRMFIVPLFFLSYSQNGIEVTHEVQKISHKFFPSALREFLQLKNLLIKT